MPGGHASPGMAGTGGRATCRPRWSQPSPARSVHGAPRPRARHAPCCPCSAAGTVCGARGAGGDAHLARGPRSLARWRGLGAPRRRSGRPARLVAARAGSASAASGDVPVPRDEDPAGDRPPPGEVLGIRRSAPSRGARSSSAPADPCGAPPGAAGGTSSLDRRGDAVSTRDIVTALRSPSGAGPVGRAVYAAEARRRVRRTVRTRAPAPGPRASGWGTHPSPGVGSTRAGKMGGGPGAD